VVFHFLQDAIMSQDKTAPSIPAQNTEQSQEEITNNLLKEVTLLLKGKKDLSPREKSIKELLKNINQLDKLEAEYQKLKVTALSEGVAK